MSKIDTLTAIGGAANMVTVIGMDLAKKKSII